MRPVQYTQISTVVDAYESQGINDFAIFQDRQLLLKCFGKDTDEGATLLQKQLEIWKNEGGGVVYTLSMYDDLPEGQKVTYTTKPDASFNFQLNKASVGSAGMNGISGMDYTNLAVENAILKMDNARLLKELEEGPDNPEEEKIMGIIGKVLEIPGMDEFLGAIGKRGAEFITGMGRPQETRFVDENGNPVQMRRVNGIGTATVILPSVEKSIVELSAALPDLPELLAKLAELSKKDRTKFNFFCGMLRKMKI